MALHEFDLIRAYFDRSSSADDVVLGVGDDAAIVQPAPGEQLVISTDTLVAGRHFPLGTLPADIGWKSLAVNLSDLAAMGANPRWCLLALTLPEADEAFLGGFAEGFWQLAQQAGIVLIGGDTTRGPLSITVTVIGSVPAGGALRRDGARVGDGIYVSHTLGGAGLGLALALGEPLSAPASVRQAALTALNRPEPQLALGLALRGLASSAIDISDGLAQDLGHILSRSNVGAKIDAGLLPLAPGLLDGCGGDRARTLALTAGDDYQLCVTIPREREAEVAGWPGLTRIGDIESEPGLRIWQEGKRLLLPQAGFQHF